MSHSYKKDFLDVLVLSKLILESKFKTSLIERFIKQFKDLKARYVINTEVLHGLQLEVLKPFKYHLKKEKNSNHKLLLIDALTEVVKTTPFNDVNEFLELYTLVFFQVYHNRKDLTVEPPEELKISVLKFGSLLINNFNTSELWRVYAKANVLPLSLGISIAVHLVKNERSITLRMEALEFLLTSSRFYFRCDQFDDKRYGTFGICKEVKLLFASYLPGILSLIEVILKNGTQHPRVCAKALMCWGHVLCLTMTDVHDEVTLSEKEIINQWMVASKEKTEELIDFNELSKQEPRTQRWFELAAGAIKPLLIEIIESRKYFDDACLLEVTKFMAALLINCTKNLKNSLNEIIEVLVSSTFNSAFGINKVAMLALKHFEEKTVMKDRTEKTKIFEHVIEENLFSLLNKLPRIAQLRDQQSALFSLDLLSGYLETLGISNRLEQLISLSSILKKLVRALQISFELEMYPEILNRNFSILDVKPKSCLWSTPWKRFRHFADKSVETKLKVICGFLGTYGSPETLFDFLLDSYKEDYGARKELLVIMNEIVLGAKEIPDHVVRQLMDFYLDPNNLYLPLEVDGVDCPNLKEAQTNIIKVALVLEGIGKLAKNLGRRFEDHLLKSLYYVLEGMGNTYEVIKQAATSSGMEISSACGLDGDIASLIEKNVDYLTYHITIKLKRNEAGVFDVITVLMKNSPLKTTPNLEDIINSVLKSSSENVNSPHTISYLRLFQTFVLCVNKWTETTKRPIQQPETNRVSEVDELVNNIKSLCVSEEETEKESEEAVEGEEIPEEPETPQLPGHVKMTLEVSNHCLHHLASKDKDKKLIVLEILNEAVWILSERENELLPLVHKIWSPLVARFDQINDPLLINRSFALLCSLCHTSKSFIRSRTLKNVLPTLRSFLIKEASASKLKGSSSDYFFTQSFKLQRELLENLGKLTSSLGLFERETDLVIESALPYLSSCQPRELQEKSIKLLQDLKYHDPYLVWFKLNDLMDDPEYAKNATIVRDNN